MKPPFGAVLLERRVKAGTIWPLPRETYARAWLSGRVVTVPVEHTELFVAAAWRVVTV